jgi:hypothetical protein
MRTLRKNSLKIAGILNIITAVLCGLLFVLMFFNLQGTKDFIIRVLEKNAAEYNVTIQTLVNFMLVYLFACFIGNGLFANIYLNYSKYDYVTFIASKKSLTFLLTLNFFISVIYIPMAFIIIALVWSPSEQEYVELGLDKLNKQRERYYKTLISTDARLFAMSLQIKMLKEKYALREISEKDYKEKLNEIISKGVNT